MGRITTILSALLLLCTGCQQPTASQGKKKSEILVKTATATEKDLQGWVETTGKLTPVASIEIRPRVRGTVQEILVRDGKTVEAGTPLFKIDSLHYQHKREELENQLNSEKTRLAFLLNKQSRYESLSDPDYISKGDRESLKLEIEQLKSTIAITEIKLKSAKQECDLCLIRSPIPGRVGKISAQVGQWISEGDKPLTTVDTVDRLVVEFSLSEDELMKLEARPIPFTVVSLAQQQHFCSSFCTFIDHQVDAKSGSIKLEGTISNKTKKFRKNQIVKVLVEGRKYQQAITVPRQAIKMNEEGPYVYKVNSENEAILSPVLVEEELDDLAIIQVGLEPGDEVVVEGHLRLYPGAKVTRKKDSI